MYTYICISLSLHTYIYIHTYIYTLHESFFFFVHSSIYDLNAFTYVDVYVFALTHSSRSGVDHP